MARVVVVIGAGASAEIGVPVMNAFLARAYDLLKAPWDPPITRDAFSKVFRLIEEHLAILYAKSNVDLHNIESVFSLVEMGRLLGRLPGYATPAEIEEIVAAVRRLVAETIDSTCHSAWNDGVAPSGPTTSSFAQ
jgi:hypothetical protein